MNELDGRISCPTCRRFLPWKLIYQIVEFHNHPQ
jgi:hypothetical protein